MIACQSSSDHMNHFLKHVSHSSYNKNFNKEKKWKEISVLFNVNLKTEMI